MNRLKFILVDSKYCDYLRKNDPCVPYTMDKKKNRPFIGVLLYINNVSYYAPLSSPKPKHLAMKNQIDLLKINGGKYGVINFNNMIPVSDGLTKPVDVTILPGDSVTEIRYKTLLANQLSWCNVNKETIMSKSQKLYNIVLNHKGWPSLISRCCNFRNDERLMKEYKKTLKL